MRPGWTSQSLNANSRVDWAAQQLTPQGAASVAPSYAIAELIAAQDAADPFARMADAVIDCTMAVAFAIGRDRLAIEIMELRAAVAAALDYGLMVEPTHRRDDRTTPRRLHDSVRVNVHDSIRDRNRWGVVPRMSRADAEFVLRVVAEAVNAPVEVKS